MATRRPRLSDLPGVVPVFPIAGALLLPGGRLPLTVFEPRYLALTDDALAAGRMFAIVQPSEVAPGPAPGLFSAGCLGRIVSFAEAGDGRYLLSLLGICRFRVRAEAQGRSGYRRLEVDYAPYASDLTQEEDLTPIPRTRLLSAVRTYLAGHGVGVNWNVLEESSDDVLVTTLAMTCPFSPEEKQALLEIHTMAERCRMMTAMIEMALLAERGGNGNAPLH